MKRVLLSLLGISVVSACGSSKGPTASNGNDNPGGTIGGTGGGSPCTGLPTVSHGGKTYNTVQIDAQCWLKENLDVGVMLPAGQAPTNNGSIEKYCYNNDAAQCATYGGLYSWNEMMAYSTTRGGKGICPDGFHVPEQFEFQILGTSLPNTRGNAVKAVGQGAGGGAGTNTTGFSALLAGMRDKNGAFSNLTYKAFLWTSSEYYPGVRPDVYLEGDNNSVWFGNTDEPAALSVRCVKT